MRAGRPRSCIKPAMLRHFRRHLGLLAGMLIAAIALGIAYRYLFNTIEERTLSFYARSALHATGMALAGWTVQMAFAALPRSRFGRVLRGMPLIAEFALKALAMTAVPTIVTLGLQFALYPSTSHEWFARDLPRIVTLAFAVSLLFSAIFEFRRLIGGRVLGSFFLGTYHRPRLEQRIVMFLDIAGDGARRRIGRSARARPDHPLLFRYRCADRRPRRRGACLCRRPGHRQLAVTRRGRAQCPLAALLLRSTGQDRRARARLLAGIRRRAAVSSRRACRLGRRQRMRRHAPADRLFRRHDECRGAALRAVQGHRRGARRLGRAVA